MNWTLGVLLVVTMIAGTKVTKEQVRSVSPTVVYNIAIGAAYGAGDIARRIVR